MTVNRYHKLAITLHWLIGIMIFGGLFAGSQILAPLDNADPEKLFSLRMHMIIGMLIGLLTIWRLIVRYRKARPPAASTGNALLDKAGEVTHILLYVLVLVMVASGVGMSILAGLPDIVFGGNGTLPASFDDLPPRTAHGIASKVLFGLVILHALAALYHQFILKDKLLGKMGIGKAPE